MTRLVALRFADPVAMVAALDDVWAAGDVALPLDQAAPTAVTDDLVHRLRPVEVRSEAGTHTTSPEAPAVPLPADAALVIATSGSTGPRKGVVLSHAALAASTAMSRTRLDAQDGVPWLGVLPLHHVAGISVVLRSRAAGREPLLAARATTDVLASAEPSWVSLVPTQLASLLAGGADLARHAGVLLGGAAAPPGLLATARARRVRVVTSYGATETCGGCVYDGIPLDGVDVRLDEGGRIGLRTPTVAAGELVDGAVSDLLDEDGWWWTSDRGQCHGERLEVAGRMDDVVVSGGENVPLAPVRAALADLAGAAASAVVGLPHARWGTSVTAVLVPTADQPTPTLATVRAALRPQLEPRHLPTSLVVGQAVPRDALGKLTPSAVLSAVEDGRATLET